jgi:hypothetical protein
MSQLSLTSLEKPASCRYLQEQVLYFHCSPGWTSYGHGLLVSAEVHPHPPPFDIVRRPGSDGQPGNSAYAGKGLTPETHGAYNSQIGFIPDFAGCVAFNSQIDVFFF